MVPACPPKGHQPPNAFLTVQGPGWPASKKHVQQPRAWQRLRIYAPCDPKAGRKAATVQLGSSDSDEKADHGPRIAKERHALIHGELPTRRQG